MTYQYTSMSTEQVEQFLAEPRNVVMGTVRKDGSPQLSVIWFVYRSGKLYTTIFNNSAKYYNIRRDPRVVVCVNAAHPDARSVTLFGTARLLEKDSDIFAEFERELAVQYHDTKEEAEAFLEAVSGDDSSLIELTPDKIIGQDYN